MNRAVMIEAEKARNLRYGTNALSLLEEMTGKSISELNEGAGVKELRAMIYCGLCWEDDKLTLEGAGDIMDVIMEKKGIEYMSNKLSKAIELALGSNQKKHPANA